MLVERSKSYKMNEMNSVTQGDRNCKWQMCKNVSWTTASKRMNGFFFKFYMYIIIQCSKNYELEDEEDPFSR